MKRKAVAAAIVVATALTGTLVVAQRERDTTPITTATSTPPPTPTRPPWLRMVRLTNEARRARGIPVLRPIKYAHHLAKIHTRKMADAERLFHSKSYPWGYWGENIGVGVTVHSLFKAFMASPDHRANMLNRHYTRIGVAFVHRDDRRWTTMVMFR